MKVLLATALACFLAGSSMEAQIVPPITAQCATSVDGSVVLIPNPLRSPVLATAFTGTLPAGNYFVRIAWYYNPTSSGQTTPNPLVTLPSPEVQIQLSGTGNVQVSPPVSGMPATAVGMQIFIGTSSGTETLQGSTIGIATFTQSTPLVTGTALPTSNTTVCQIIANDAGWPSGTGYVTTMTTPSGATMPGYPMQWQLLGPGNTINLSQGLPLYNGTVSYPVPVLARPYGHGPQSISGPLSLSNYNLTTVLRLGVGTAVPAWGVDVEGAGVNGAVNAKTGYVFNGAAPLNHALLGNGSYYIDSATLPYAILSGAPTLFYQTVAANGTARTQRPTLNFSSYFTVTDSPSPAQSTVAPVTTGSEAKLVTAAAAGTNTDCVVWNANGGIGDAGSPCLLTGLTKDFAVAGCAPSTSTDAGCTGNAVISPAFADNNYIPVLTVNANNGAFLSISVSGALVSNSIPYTITCTFNCGTIVTPTIYVHAFHP